MTVSTTISWRPRHEVHEGRAPAPDFLAFDGERIVGRMFQITHSRGAGRWFWTVMATGPQAPDAPPTGVAERRADAAHHLVEAYERLIRG